MIRRVLPVVVAGVIASTAAAAQDLPATKGLHQLQADIPGAGRVLYAVSVPDGYDPKTPAPLVLVLHPGGQRMPYYGYDFTRRIVEPALRQLRPIMIAPDCPLESRSWSDAEANTAVMALMEKAMREYSIDRRRVLVVGYSMGGRGTWHMAATQQPLFTAAIPMAASTRGLTIDQLGRQPTYIIHSRADEVVDFEPAEQIGNELKKLGRDVHFEALDDLTHFDMGSYVDALRQAGRWVAGKWKQ
jgi:predicted peptidase